ncbi:UNKNOWN [Stylonychia lemnae]|uniref:Uncharacterized protein n=1 Tax=Stylonychia lemnae TaxID=5949 RepID=A0A078ANN5_STYLE|nr:UNKNOWN [Stylonychia lemnae]|eukprot:CDW82578.1 UNKNOWN [Stylonychia lemnae]
MSRERSPNDRYINKVSKKDMYARTQIGPMMGQVIGGMRRNQSAQIINPQTIRNQRYSVEISKSPEKAKNSTALLFKQVIPQKPSGFTTPQIKSRKQSIRPQSSRTALPANNFKSPNIQPNAEAISLIAEHHKQSKARSRPSSAIQKNKSQLFQKTLNFKDSTPLMQTQASKNFQTFQQSPQTQSHNRPMSALSLFGGQS